MKLKEIGDKGEIEVTKLVSCPNCEKDLTRLPEGYPLVDIQCVACNFRAQIKTINTKPKNTIKGAGWQIIDKVTKSGYLVSPLIVNFKWKEKLVEKQKIIFYPFLSKKINLKKYQLSETARRSNYQMFNYINLDKAPSKVLFEK